MTRRVLVTGASGFVGLSVLPALAERGFDVHGVRRKAGPAADGFQWHRADLHDSGEVRSLVRAVNPTHLLHLAWYAEPGAFWTSEENLRWVGSSLTLLREFTANGGRRAVLAGSCAEYDWTVDPLEESSTLAPSTLYGASKDALRRVAAAYAEQSGLEFAWGRLFFMYGPNEPRGKLVSSIIESVLAGEIAKCSTGEQVRDFLHVEDAARAFAAIVDSPITGPVNVGSGKGTEVREIATMIGKASGNPKLIELGALPRRPDDPPSIVADIRKLRSGTDWSPLHDLEMGLAGTLDWWRTHPAGEETRGNE